MCWYMHVGSSSGLATCRLKVDLHCTYRRGLLWHECVATMDCISKMDVGSASER